MEALAYLIRGASIEHLFSLDRVAAGDRGGDAQFEPGAADDHSQGIDDRLRQVEPDADATRLRVYRQAERDPGREHSDRHGRPRRCWQPEPDTGTEHPGSSGRLRGLCNPRVDRRREHDHRCCSTGCCRQHERHQGAQALAGILSNVVGGRLSIAQGGNTITASGTVRVAGTLGVTQGAQTITAKGGPIVVGTLSASQQDTLIAAGYSRPPDVRAQSDTGSEQHRRHRPSYGRRHPTDPAGLQTIIACRGQGHGRRLSRSYTGREHPPRCRRLRGGRQPIYHARRSDPDGFRRTDRRRHLGGDAGGADPTSGKATVTVMGRAVIDAGTPDDRERGRSRCRRHPLGHAGRQHPRGPRRAGRRWRRGAYAGGETLSGAGTVTVTGRSNVTQGPNTITAGTTDTAIGTLSLTQGAQTITAAATTFTALGALCLRRHENTIAAAGSVRVNADHERQAQGAQTISASGPVAAIIGTLNSTQALGRTDRVRDHVDRGRQHRAAAKGRPHRRHPICRGRRDGCRLIRLLRSNGSERRGYIHL